MRNKGFTLVELLGVIVIMAIIILMAVPAYNAIQRNMLKKQNEQIISYIELQAEKFITEENIVSAYNEYDITVGTILQYGFLDSDEDNKNVIYNAYGEDITCNIVTIKTKNNNAFAEFKEKKECDINTQVYIDQNIKLEAYENRSGNKTLIGYAASNESNAIVLDRRLNWVNSNIILHLTIPESSTYNVNAIKKITWNTTNDVFSADDGIWLDNITGFSESGDYKNVYYIDNVNEIMNDTKYRVSVELEYYDEFNNIKIERISTYLIIRIDKQPPLVTAHAEESWGPKEKTITIIGSDKEGSGISHFCVNTISTYDADTCTRVDLLSNSYTKATIKRFKGVYYIWATDKAGNVSTTPAYVNIDNIDNKGPTCVYSGESTTWAKTRSITVSCDDGEDGSGCITEPQVYTYNTGEIKVDNTKSYKIVDVVGNETTCNKPLNVYIDNKGPECSVNPIVNANDWAKARTITSQCIDTYSGCAGTNPSVAYGAGKTVDNATNSSFASYTLSDTLGNTSTCPTTEYNVYVDSKAPTCSYQRSNAGATWTTQNVTITAKCSDNLSGCIVASKPYTFNKTTKTSVLDFVAQDNAGNTTPCNQTQQVLVDKDTHTCAITYTGTVGENGIFTALSNYSYAVYNNPHSIGYTAAVVTNMYNNGKYFPTKSVLTFASGATATCVGSPRLDTANPGVSIAKSGANVIITATDDYALGGYAITQTAAKPSSWTAISGKSLVFSPYPDTTFYVHIKDAAGRWSYAYNVPACSYAAGTYWDFNYINGMNSFQAPCNGTYLFEAYGAQGGSGYTGTGGLGGYANGYVYLTKGTTVYVAVGGQGISYAPGYAFNGGGSTRNGNDGWAICGGGGGATSISSANGTINNVNAANLYLVAGGGGGGGWMSWNSGYSLIGGAGGGLVGGNAVYDQPGNSVCRGGGGTQSSGGVMYPCQTGYYYQPGSYGTGGSQPQYVGAGGGGGYYGGSSGAYYNGCTSGGGGSSYIGGVSSGYTAAGQRSGHGFARIWLSSY